MTELEIKNEEGKEEKTTVVADDVVVEGDAQIVVENDK